MQFVGYKLSTVSLNKQPWRIGELVSSLTLICLVRFYLCQPYIAETKAISVIICHMFSDRIWVAFYPFLA